MACGPAPRRPESVLIAVTAPAPTLASKLSRSLLPGMPERWLRPERLCYNETDEEGKA